MYIVSVSCWTSEMQPRSTSDLCEIIPYLLAHLYKFSVTLRLQIATMYMVFPRYTTASNDMNYACIEEIVPEAAVRKDQR